MAEYAKPESHANRLIFLTRAAATGQADITAGRNYVTQATIDAVNARLVPYRLTLNTIPPASAGRSKEIRERNEAIEVVATYVRDLWDVLKRRVKRLGQPPEVLQYYGLPLDGIVPRPITADEWLLAANGCIGGDAAAVTAGYPAMANPSAGELTPLTTAATTEASEVSDADRIHDEALAAADALVADVDLVIEDVMAELRFNTRRLDYASQRRIQRTYGARFRNASGEPSEGEYTQELGRGDGMRTNFMGMLLNPPIEAGSVSATDGLEAFTDTDNGDGSGTLTGSAGGTGSIQYTTGSITINFNTPPAPDQPISVSYLGEPNSGPPKPPAPPVP
jgi:hypothetical protein